MKNIVILGSTGSIGRQTIDVCERYPNLFRIVGLSANRQIGVLEDQIRSIEPLAVAVGDMELAAEWAFASSGSAVDVYTGADGLLSLCRMGESDTVVNALVGSIGLKPTLTALKEGKNLCLSNKESLVVGGELVGEAAEASGRTIIPIDSEHSAVFQCLQGEDISRVEKLIITGSGGPFRGRKMDDLKDVTVDEALAHPRWRMGKKISIDSATMMNKGLEVIEAHFLFGLPYSSIEVVINPESIVHSMVQFKDGSIIAQLALPDMRLPIQYALTFPDRMASPVEAADLPEIGTLSFEKPDMDNFPCLKYSYEAARAGKTYPAVLNAANEEAVAAFLEKKIGFLDISDIIYKVLNVHKPEEVTDLSSIEEAEIWARDKAQKIISSLKGG